MQKSESNVFRLTGAYVEAIHDDLVARLWPGKQPVGPNEYRDRALIESAVSRPFQSFGGQEFYKTLFEKAAPLFHSLVCNHPFGNGNKRTAVLAADLFLVANGFFLALDNDQMYRLAKRTAMHNAKGIPCETVLRRIAKRFRDFSVPFEKIKDDPKWNDLYKAAVEARNSVRKHPGNRMPAVSS